ncbi:hypothetical protein Pan44_19870 [Caulifigura coniformis]|uniref:Uncharacterized protein n=1 Tax=Caulifigura coniformis TaxID=2527983 RepID=A0A517SCV1_9PLAN|nr:outer membrane protein assembly factor BamE [Caulifigura coniformis]QDT53960.1 hypothetical protein Pan44_19870 [Caulifigura coniformis]
MSILKRHIGKLIALVAISPLIALYYRESCRRVSSDAASLINDGMSQAEVIAVLGEPHWKDREGDWYYSRYEPLFFLRVGFGNDPLHVGFDNNGRVNWISLG